MSADKKVRLEFVVDQTSLNSVTRAFEQVAEAAARAASAMGNGGGGLLTGIAGSSMPGTGTGSAMNKAAGGGTGAQDTRSQLTKYVMDNLDALKKIGDANKDVARIVSEAMGNAFRTQISDLKELNKQAEEYRNNLTRLKTERERVAALPESQYISKSKVIAKHDQEIAENELALAQVEVERRAKRAEVVVPSPPWNANNPAAGGAPPQGPGGPGTGVFSSFLGKAGGLLKRGGAVGFTVAAAGAVQESLQDVMSEDVNNRRRRVASGASMYGRTIQNDLKPLMAIADIRERAEKGDAYAQEQLGVWMGQQDGIVGTDLKAGAKHAVSKLDLLGIFGGGQNQGGTAFNQLKGDQDRTRSMERLMGHASAEADAMALTRQYALDQFTSNVHSRIGVGRILGTGFNLNPKTKKWEDSHGDFESRLLEQGYDIGQYTSAKGSLLNSVGRQAASKHAESVMAASAAGYGGWGGLIEGSERSGGGARFALGALGGNIDTGAGIQLGQAIIGNGYNPFGQTGGFGTLAAFQNGSNWTGTSADFNKVMAIQGAIRLGNSITTGGFDPWQKSQNLINAVQANPSMGLYGQDYLANGMQFNQMVDIAAGGKLTETARAFGVDRGAIKQQLSDSVTSFINRYYNDGSAPVSKYINGLREFIRSGKGGISEYLKSLGGDQREAIKMLGAWYGYESGQGEEAGIAMMEAEAGMGGEGKSRKHGPSGGMGAGEKALSQKMAADQKAFSTALENMGGKIVDVAKAAPDFTQAINTFSGNLKESATNVVLQMAGLGEAVQELTQIMKLNPNASAAKILKIAQGMRERKAGAPSKPATQTTVGSMTGAGGKGDFLY